MVVRYQLSYAKKRLFKGKALIIYGSRQAGKTTFANMLIESSEKEVLRFNADEADVRELFERPNVSRLKAIIGKAKIVLIDEAQRIEEAGLLLKILVDNFKDVQVIATGSSSFELAGRVNESLTGRKYEIFLHPLSYSELVNHNGLLEEERSLEQRLIYGSYPEIINHPDMAEEHLKLLCNSYLYKDIFALERISRPVVFEKIVKALALQVGSEVNMNEIAQLVKCDYKTVDKYIALLEKAFVVFRLPAYSGNVRNEIKKGFKVYFYDNGIINAITGTFEPISKRKDIGSLWENYLVSERLKRNNFLHNNLRTYFWRTTQQQEIDFIEEGNELNAFEFKWNSNKNVKFSKTFTEAYPKAQTILVNPKTVNEFLFVE